MTMGNRLGQNWVAPQVIVGIAVERDFHVGRVFDGWTAAGENLLTREALVASSACFR